MKIPNLNLNDTAPYELSLQIEDALKRVGFLRLSNHGIELEKIKRAYKVAEDFFSLPLDTKLKLSMRGTMLQPRGYMVLAPEESLKTLDSLNPRYKEMWHLSPEWASSDSGVIDNLWPEESAVASFRKDLLALATALRPLAERVLEACARPLGFSASAFTKSMLNGPSLMRVLHYPPQGAQESEPCVRFDEHEDLSLLTLMCEANAPGLEIQGHDGRWWRSEGGSDDIIVNSGEFLQKLSGGCFRSAPHRVVSAQDRISMPIFVIPDLRFNLQPGLPTELSVQKYLEQRIPELPRY